MSGERPTRKPACRSEWILLGLWLTCSLALADGFAQSCTDRAAIERVYYEHRLGNKPPFEETLPPATLEKLVRKNLKKEAVLRKAYRVIITPPMLDAEVRRINSTTRAPKTLAEIKSALGNDPVRFARSFAKPFLVERLLREKFENDDALHAPRRHECEAVRARLLNAKANGASVPRLLSLLKDAAKAPAAVTETTWQLTPRPASPPADTAEEIEIKERFGPNAQLLASPKGTGTPPLHYFTDLPEALQRVLQAQLRGTGDISAVLEMPGAFLLYVAAQRTEKALSVEVLSLPKLNYEKWLAEQPE